MEVFFIKVWLNGELVGWDRANVPILSHSFSRGSAIFEVMDIVMTDRGPAYFGLNEHVERFYQSAEMVYMNLPYDQDELKEACLLCARENEVNRGGAKFYAYFPAMEFTEVPQNDQVDIAIFCLNFDLFGITQEELSKPVSAGISKYIKLHKDTMPIHAKVVGNYVNAYLAIMDVKARGYEDAILLDSTGHIAEGPAASLFFVREGKLVVPPLDNVLKGITRIAVEKLAQLIGIKVEICPINPNEIGSMEEAFYAVSLKKIVPIKDIDGRPLKKDCPGPVTQKIISSMDDVYSGRNVKFMKWLTMIE